MTRSIAARRGPRMRLRLPRLGAAPQAVVLLLVLGLVSAMAIQPTRQLLEQRRRIEGMAADLGELRELNRDLEDHIARLQDPDYIEQLAREQTGLVRPGEQPYVVLPPRRGAGGETGDRRAQASDPRPEPAAEPGLVDGFLDFIALR